MTRIPASILFAAVCCAQTVDLPKPTLLVGTPEGILMTKDSTRAYVAEAGENRLAIRDLKTLEVTGHLTTGNGPDGMAWSDRR